MTYRRVQCMLSKIGHPLYTRDGVLAEVRRLIAEMGDAYDPLAVRCRYETCNAAFRAPADVEPGHVLACPSCGATVVVIDTGNNGRVEYVRTRNEPEQPVIDPDTADMLLTKRDGKHGTRPLCRKPVAS